MNYKVSVVSYQNTIPFVYGLKNHSIYRDIELSLDHPSECARKVIDGSAHIGLVPVAIQSQLQNGRIISDYCIGSEGAVRSVIIYSNMPINSVKTIFLDYQSETSIRLARLLAERFWNIQVQWVHSEVGFENRRLNKNEAAVVIGDRSFLIAKNYEFVYDLSLEWEKYSGLPFVFATWNTRLELDPDFESQFNNALRFGVTHIEEAVSELGNSKVLSRKDLISYLTENIDYHLNDRKKKALSKFLSEISILKI